MHVASEYAGGLSTVEIGKKYGIAPATVCRILRDCAQPVRTISESASLRAGKATCGGLLRSRKLVFQSKKMGKWMPAASTYEYARLQQLENDDDVLWFGRCADRIPYTLNNKTHHYTPDIVVERRSSGTSVEEIKPSELVGRQENQAKAMAATEFYRHLGVSYRIVTQVDIGLDYLKSFEWSGIANICNADAAAWRKEQDRKRRRDWARENYRKNPPSREKLDAHKAKQIARYRAWRDSASEEEIKAHRAKVAAYARRKSEKNLQLKPSKPEKLR